MRHCPAHRPGPAARARAIHAATVSAVDVSTPPSIAKITFPEDRLYFTGVVVVISVALALTYHFTRFGLATRAGAENDLGRR